MKTIFEKRYLLVEVDEAQENALDALLVYQKHLTQRVYESFETVLIDKFKFEYDTFNERYVYVVYFWCKKEE